MDINKIDNWGTPQVIEVHSAVHASKLLHILWCNLLVIFYGIYGSRGLFIGWKHHDVGSR